MIPNFKEMYQGSFIVGGWMCSLFFKMFLVSGAFFMFPLAAGCVMYFILADLVFSDMVDMLAAQQILTPEFTVQFLSFVIREKTTIIITWSLLASLLTILLEFVVGVWVYTIYRFCCHYSESQMNRLSDVKPTENSILPS
mgnify:FL=1